MAQQHQAAFLDGANKPLRIAPTATQQPGAGEVLVKAAAVAINPVDWKLQTYGGPGFIRQWPIVLGEDIAGEIVEVGEDVTKPGIAKGQRVILHSTFLLTQKPEQGGFQEFVIAPQASVSPLPDAISYEDGVVLPIAVSTAAAGLFQPEAEGLGLDLPSTQGKKKNGKTLLLWGASSSVGAAAIQLAVAAGYDIVATASPRNFGLAKELGARAVFAYNSPSVVADLVAELEKQGEFVGAYDAISTRETQRLSAQVVQQLGGGSLVLVDLPEAGGEGFPETVLVKNVVCLTIFAKYPDVGKAVWQDFLPEALKAGQFKTIPPPEVVGKGLESLQAAFDKQKAGVSAKKIVVTL